MDNIISVAKRICDLALTKGAENAEGFVRREEEGSTRFANSQVIQTTDEIKYLPQVRVVLRGGIGGAMGNSFEEEALKRIVDYAVSAAKVGKDPSFQGFPKGPFVYPPTRGVRGGEGWRDPELRVDIISQAINLCHQYSPLIDAVTGNLVSRNVDVALCNTNGVEVWDHGSGSDLFLNVTARNYMGESKASIGSSWSAQAGEVGPVHAEDLEKLNVEKACQEVSSLAVKGLNAKRVEPDRYTVVFTPPAVSGILRWLAMALSSRNALKRLSPLSGKLGEDVALKVLTVSRNPTLRFDGEGLPTKELDFIDKGNLITFAYDTTTAAIFGVESNGCADRAPMREANPMGFPTHYQPMIYPSAGPLRVSGGKASSDELINSVDRGIMVTNLSYQSMLDGPQGIITAMTRNGTFIIEEGEIAYPIKNMRVTDTLLRLMKNVTMISCGSPSIKVEEVPFTGTTVY